MMPGFITFTQFSRFSKVVQLTTFVAIYLAHMTSISHGQVAGGGPGSIGGGGRGLIQISGRVVCIECSLDDVNKTLPDDAVFYQLEHQQGVLIIQVDRVNDIAGFRSFAWPPMLRIRTQDSLFRTLAAEGNRLKDIQLLGFLSGVRTLNMVEVTISGVTVRAGV